MLNKWKLNLKKGQLVSYTLNNVSYTVEILNWAGKTTWSYKNSFNVEYKHQDQEENKKGFVDFDRVDYVKILAINKEIYQVDSDCFESSKQTELENWEQNQVLVTSLLRTENKFSHKWVCSLKLVSTIFY